MNDNWRNIFGCLAFAVTTCVIAAVLSPYVPADKEAIANIVLGNVLGWPLMVLAFFYGSSSGSKEKTHIMAHKDAYGDLSDAGNDLEGVK